MSRFGFRARIAELNVLRGVACLLPVLALATSGCGELLGVDEYHLSDEPTADLSTMDQT
jgi:hypothetical protein